MRIVGIASFEQQGSAGVGKDTVADRLVHKHGFVRVALADPMKRFAASVFGFSEAQLWGSTELRNGADRRFQLDALDSYGGAVAWMDAWMRMEKLGPEWLAMLGLDANVIAQLRHWLFSLTLQASGVNMKGYRAPAIACSPRHVLQKLGTEFGRAQNTLLWVDHMMATASTVLTSSAWRYSYRFGISARSALPVDDPPPGVVCPDVRFSNEVAAIRTAGGIILGMTRPGAEPLKGVAGEHLSEHGLFGVEPDVLLTNSDSLEFLHAQVDRFVEGWRKEAAA